MSDANKFGYIFGAMIFVFMLSMSAFGVVMLIDWNMHMHATTFIMCSFVISAVYGWAFGAAILESQQ